MHTVMIVDGQKRMLNIYKKMIDWEAFNYEIISYANSQSQAISYFREYHHDLIIMDICLESGDGISLIREFKDCDENCNIVVCTYENNYSILRRIWRLGVIDVLQKNELRGVLIIENIELIGYKDKFDAPSMGLSALDELQKMLGLIRDKQLVDVNRFQNTLKRTGILQSKQDFRLIFFRMDSPKSVYLSDLSLDRDTFSSRMKNVICSVMDDCFDYNIIFSKKHSGVILIKNEYDHDLKKLSNQIINAIKNTLNVSVSMYISRKCTNLQMFYESYIEWVNSLNKKFYLGESSVIFLEKVPSFQYIDYKRLKIKEDILKCFVLQEYERITDINIQFFHYIKAENIDPADVVYYCIMIINSIRNYVEKHISNSNEVMMLDLHTVFSKLETFNDVVMEYNDIIKKLIIFMQMSSKQKYSKLIFDVNQYIEEHISEKITVSEIEKNFGLTAIHISRVFKQQTGESLVQYINRQKMTHAKYLLMNTSLKIKEVAELVGYSDQLYFNKVFKKQYNINPRDFKKTYFDV